MRIPVIALALGLLLVMGCDESKAEKQRQASVEARSEVFAKAESKYQLPVVQNFPMRGALTEYTKRQDQLDHPWYIYVLGDQGNTIGYFVGKTYPQSTCNFLSSTEVVNSSENGKVVLTAPSLDGIYYGGGGSKGGGCDYFFFDVATDAMQVIHHDLRWFVSDKPLSLKADAIQVAR